MREIARQPEALRRDLFQETAAKPGSLQLLPPPHNRKELAKDYASMQAMLFGAIPDFETIEEGLANLEQRINAS